MMHCPACKSDSIEKNSLIGLRVIGCIILLFIPYGLFLCWIPFIIPYTFTCKVCGYSGNEKELISIDWREKEMILKEMEELEKKLSPIMNKWYSKDDGKLYKVVGDKTQNLLLEFTDNRVVPYIIVDYIVGTFPPELLVKDQLKTRYSHNRPYEGKFISEEEYHKYEHEDRASFLNWLQTNNILIDSLEKKVV